MNSDRQTQHMLLKQIREGIKMGSLLHKMGGGGSSSVLHMSAHVLGSKLAHE
jgi:hypothetical protein